MNLAALTPTRHGARSYRRLRVFAAAVLMAQFVIGLGGTLTPAREIFPFASWFLFSLVPDRVVSYDVLLRGTDERLMNLPTPFREAGGRVKSPHAITAYQVIQQLGRAIETGEGSEVRRCRRELEAQFAGAGMRYDVVRNSYRLADRWRGKPAPAPALLASYRAGEGLQ